MILRRYESIEINLNTENERMNLLNKIRSLAECLQDPNFNYNFSDRLIKESSSKICLKIDDIRINFSKSINEDNYDKDCGIYTLILKETEFMLKNQLEKIHTIFQTCRRDFAREIYANILYSPLNKVLDILEENLKKIQKSNVKRLDFYLSIDMINCYYENLKDSFESLIGEYDEELHKELINKIKNIELECINYLIKETKKINEETSKIKDESILEINSKTMLFLNKICYFHCFYKRINNYSESSTQSLNIEDIIYILINRLEKNSKQLEKKHLPLKFIFLINNFTFIQSKLTKPPLKEYLTKNFNENLNSKFKEYLNNYLDFSWNKIEETTFNDSDMINILNSDDTLKSQGKDLIKRKFIAFNETMKNNLKNQQNAQIVDSVLEREIINSNIEKVVKPYMKFFKTYSSMNFSKSKEKILIYQSEADIERDLKLYFSNPLGNI